MISLLSLKDVADALQVEPTEMLSWLESEGVRPNASGEGRLFYHHYKVLRWVRSKVRSGELPSKPPLPKRRRQIPRGRIDWGDWTELSPGDESP